MTLARVLRQKFLHWTQPMEWTSPRSSRVSGHHLHNDQGAKETDTVTTMEEDPAWIFSVSTFPYLIVQLRTP